MKTIITHSGGFHADEVIATAMLAIYLDQRDEKYTVIRTRDPEVIKTGDYILDIGREYDPAGHKFDHHQKEGAGVRDNGIPYATCGLMWKHIGKELCGDNQELWQNIEEHICEPIDAHDSGMQLPFRSMEHLPYSIGQIVSSYENPVNGARKDEEFMQAMQFAKDFLSRIIAHAKDIETENQKAREVFADAKDGIAIFDGEAFWQAVQFEFPEVKAVVYQSNGEWRAKTTQEDREDSFKRWVYFPEAWAGLDGEVLEKASGIKGLYFCHRHRFTIAATTKEAAVEAARQAIESFDK